MDQISPPFRIALVALLGVCALWFTVLKPKDPAAQAPPAPSVTAPAAATPATTRSTPAAAPDASASKAAPRARTAAAPKAAPADRTAPLLRALDRKQAVVLLFWNPRGIEDRAVHRAVGAVTRRDGRVLVKSVPVAAVGRYEAITRGVKVLESPTVLVIGPDRKVKPIVGYTITGEVDQAVADVLAKRGAAK